MARLDGFNRATDGWQFLGNRRNGRRSHTYSPSDVRRFLEVLAQLRQHGLRVLLYVGGLKFLRSLIELADRFLMIGQHLLGKFLVEFRAGQLLEFGHLSLVSPRGSFGVANAILLSDAREVFIGLGMVL